MKGAFKHAYTVLAALLMALSCAEGDKYVAVTGFAQGGVYSVKFNTRGVEVPLYQIQSAVDSILTLVDTTLSGYNKGSLLSRLNAGETIVPNPLLKDVYSYCHRLYEETGGCVDVAAGPLFDIWGFGFKTDSLPSDEMVTRTMESCGMRRLKPDMDAVLDSLGRLDPRSLLARPYADGTPPMLNFNAVAQGYTSDLVAEYLYSAGVRDMLVDIGEIFCDGLNPSRKGWTIGVDRPVDGNDSPGADVAAVWLSDGGPCGLVTSGNYRKFYIRGGKKYAHTIDTRTGYPVTHQLLSATIKAPTSAAADAYATYCMVLGPDGARSFIESRPDIEGYLLYAEGDGMTGWASEGFSLREN